MSKNTLNPTATCAPKGSNRLLLNNTAFVSEFPVLSSDPVVSLSCLFCFLLLLPPLEASRWVMLYCLYPEPTEICPWGMIVKETDCDHYCAPCQYVIELLLYWWCAWQSWNNSSPKRHIMLLKETIKSLEGWLLMKFCSQSSRYFGIYFPGITMEGSKHDDVFVLILLLGYAVMPSPRYPVCRAISLTVNSINSRFSHWQR